MRAAPAASKSGGEWLLWADSFEMRHWMDIEGEREQEVEKDRDIDRGPGHSH